MKYFIGTESECISLNLFISNTYFNGWNYSAVYEAADGSFYILVREEDLHLLSDEQMAHVFDNVNPKEMEQQA